MKLWLFALCLLTCSITSAKAATSFCGSVAIDVVGPCSITSPAPGGRISDNTSSCTHTADGSSPFTTLYYIPCVNNYVPISTNGTATGFVWELIPATTTNLSTAYSTFFTANTIFDFYVTIQSGSIVYCAVKWGTSTAGSSSRGSSAAIQNLAGIVVNNFAATCNNGSTAYTLTVGEATLLGSFFTNGTATDVPVTFSPAAASGGAVCNIGYANVYNVTAATCTSLDNKSSWTYASATIQEMDGSTTNQGSWIDPLGTFPYSCRVQVVAHAGTVETAGGPAVGCGINSTTAFSGIAGSAILDVTTVSPSLTATAVGAAPQSTGGLNYAAALQQSYSGSVTTTFYGSGLTNTPQTEGLVLTTLY